MRVMIIAMLVLLCWGIGGGKAEAQPGPADPEQEQVAFDSDGVTLRGAVYRPTGAGPHPGIVLIGGSGPGPRAEYHPEAAAFARAGITTLVVDKRTVGYSTSHRDFSVLADDALAGVRLLRDRPDVDAARVGLWGFSEGGWVATLAASRSSTVGFVVTIGGSGLTPLRTQTWYLSNLLRHNGVSGHLPDAVSGPGAAVVEGLGAFPEADYDPVPALRHVRVPVLALWGDHDVKVPSGESATIFQHELVAAGNHSVTTRLVPHAGHNGHRTTDGFDSVGGELFEGKPLGELDPGYTDVMTDWIHAVAADQAPPTSAATPPHQTAGRAPGTHPGLEYAALAALLLGFATYPLSALGRMILRRSPSEVGRGPHLAARAVSAVGLLATLGTVTYVVGILATGGKLPPTALILGQPLPWLLLHALALAVPITAAILALSTWRTRAQMHAPLRRQTLILLATAMAFVPWALHWQLFSR
ncbi:prolyl oligopeptidase family serine peptidase [Nocardia sp. NPDC051981]|uniref:alpha/beta hydrolase family protein n=1 Tax=Nocardia sp. NPDC051981 TaxID=3155417 RepID=UPI003449E5D6